MDDVARGQEPNKIPLLPGAPTRALRDLQNTFEYITHSILPSGLHNSLGDDDADFACECEDNVRCDGNSIECACVIDHGV